MLNKFKQLSLLLKAHNNGWKFNEVEGNDGAPIMLGIPPTSHMSDIQPDLQASMNVFSEFLTWSINYDGPTEDFYRQYQERIQFVLIAISGLMREPTPQPKQ